MSNKSIDEIVRRHFIAFAKDMEARMTAQMEARIGIIEAKIMKRYVEIGRRGLSLWRRRMIMR